MLQDHPYSTHAAKDAGRHSSSILGPAEGEVPEECGEAGQIKEEEAPSVRGTQKSNETHCEA